MATVLDKDLTRETTIEVDGRLILVTITADQQISMKLKGMKSGTVSIGISELYAQLTSNGSVKTISASDTVKPKKQGVNSISLHDLRHRCMIKGFDYETTAKLDGVIQEILSEK